MYESLCEGRRQWMAEGKAIRTKEKRGERGILRPASGMGWAFM